MENKMNLDKLDLSNKKEGIARVNEMMAMQLDGNNLLPKPITYKDIDKEVTRLVDDEFSVTFDGGKVKTFFFTQQRMSEFTKTWETVDENKNPIPNFKIVTRENNPKPGTLMGGMANIPGEPFFPIGTFEKRNGDKNITVTCKMKQPYCVDIMYNVKFVTNKLSLLNELNNNIVDMFKSKQSYIVVCGHYMPVTLEDVGDESDYDLDERKIFVQNFELKVAGYIINEKDIIFEENISKIMLGIEINNKVPRVISQITSKTIDIEFPRKSKIIIKFKSSGFFEFFLPNSNYTNISSYEIFVNGSLIETDSFILNKYDNVTVKINRINRNELSRITLVPIPFMSGIELEDGGMLLTEDGEPMISENN